MTLWYGAQASVKIGDALSSVATDSTLESQFTGTDFSAEVKEIRFTGGEASVDVLNVMGDQVKEESRPGLKSVEFTMIFSDIDALEWFGGSASAIGATGYERISFSDKTGSKENKAILFKVTDGTNTVVILMNNAWFTTTGEISLAADGSAELTMTAVCLIDDYYVEDNIS